jgi:hypothetical protein
MRLGNRRRILARAVSAAAFAALAWSGSLLAQGVTTGSVRGHVTDEGGNAVVGAVLTLVNSQTGIRYTVRSREDGIFDIENVTPGGPFTLSARAIGYRQMAHGGIRVDLSQVVTVNLTLPQAAVELEALNVMGAAENPLTATSRTGASTLLTDSMIANLPSLSRNFTDFIGSSPLVNGGSYPSIAGQNNRFNNIQIDGGVNNDLFGLGSTGTPGGQVGEIPISASAIKQFQILIAPFDVRQGGFTGGLVNAITKSGTNQFHGSLYFYGQNQDFGRKTVDRGLSWAGDSLGTDVQTKFHQYQYGGTLGGPIIRDRLQFFAAVDLRSRQSPFGGYLQGSDAIDLGAYGVTQAQADSVISWSKTNLNTDPGSAGQINDDNPDHNIFVKLNGQVTPRSQIEVSYNDVTASDGSLIRSYSFSGYRSGYELGNAGYRINNTTRTGRLRYNAAIGDRFTNELILGYQQIRDLRNPGMNTPLIFVGGNGGAVSIGAERYSQGNVLKQDNYEITDNLTIGYGHHLLTVGTHNELFKFYNQFFPGSYGVWYFPSTTALYNDSASHYEIALPLRTNGPLAQFKVNQLGVYAQDIWNVTPKFKLTFGLRLDDPLLPDKPDANPTLAAVPFVHVADNGSGAVSDTAYANTGGFSTAMLWSPRVGFNYDLHGDQSTIIRGGVGVFSGRPPYVWVSNAYANSGLTQATLSCTNGATVQVPGFVADINNQPQTCVGGGAASPPTPSIVYFDHNFSFPQTLRLALGGDQTLPWDMVGTVDLLYTRTLNQFYLNDVNLAGVQSVNSAEGGRLMYGAVNPANGFTTPTRVTSSFRDVIRQYNSSGDNSWQATISLDKRFSNHVSFNVGYTYSKTKDRMCMTSSISSSNFRYAVLQGPLDNRPLSTSCFDVPHHLVATVLFDAPMGFKASLTYSGTSGTPFTWINNYDANGDGWGGNDPIYVPTVGDTTYISGAANRAKFNAFIDQQSCLSSQRGHLMARNSCRNPWTNFINARIAKTFPTISGQSFQLSLDIFNLPNLISSSWFQNKQTCFYEGCAAVNIIGQAPSGESINSLNSSGVNYLNAISPSWNRYRLLLSGSYTF